LNRQQARELAASTLSSLATYALVAEGARRKLGGVSPVAIVLSKGTQIVQLTRDTHNEAVHRLSVTVYVRCDEGGEDAAEDNLDTLAEAAAVALKNAGFLVGESDASPEGSPLRLIDGAYYRAEVLVVQYEEWL